MDNIKKLFFKKNLKQIKFHWKSITLLIVGSLIILLIYLYSTKQIVHHEKTTFEINSIDLLKTYFTGEDDDFIFYNPSDEFLDNLMEKIRLELSLRPEQVFAFGTKQEMFLNLEEKRDSRSFGITFDSYPPSSRDSRNLNYSLTATTLKAPNWKKFVNDDEVVGIKEHDDYIGTGFFLLQHVIDNCFYKMQTQASRQVQIEVATMPHIETVTIDSLRLTTFGVIFSMLFYIILLSTYIVPLVEEKQDGIKDFLILATPYHHWNEITFFVIRLIMYSIFSIIVMFMGYICKGIGDTPIIYMFLLILLFILSSMCYAQALTTLFKNGFSAKIGGFMLLIGPCLSFAFENRHPITSILVSVLHGNAFIEGIRIFQVYNNKHRDFTIFTLADNITEHSFKMLNIYMILIIQCFVYLFLYKLIAFVIAGEQRRHIARHTGPVDLKTQKDLESCNDDAKYTVRMEKLTKIYLSRFKNLHCCTESKTAVKDLDMKLLDNSITVLLGHNGAGKTTVINMIVGNIERTSGKIYVCGEENSKNFGHLIGFCPQHDVFMRYMTCREHLEFFSELRGTTTKQLGCYVKDLLRQLRLEDKSDVYAKNLSGGMKRRLSLGIAVSGDTKVIILDEPTSGLDPESRRKLWNILLELRKTRTMLISTHHMEEAEILGDRISILSQGKLIRSGTSLELKREYGSGYILKLLINNKFDKEKVIKNIQAIIPSASELIFNGPTFSIMLPYSERNKYAKLLERLEKKIYSWGIESISITDTALEDVFLKCKPETDEIDSNCNEKYERLRNSDILKDDSNNNLLQQQLLAIFYKKYLFISSKFLFITILLSLLIIGTMLSFILIVSSNFMNENLPLRLGLNNTANNATIYIKLEPNFYKLRSCLDIELKKSNVTPIFIEDQRESIELRLIEEQQLNLSYFYEDVLGALKISGDPYLPRIKLLYSPNIIHSSVVMLNLVDNIILKDFDCSHGRIEIWNLPFNRLADTTIKISSHKLDFYSTIMPVVWFITMIFYLILPFKEEQSGFKELQPLSGFWYWFGFTAFDFLMHFIICCFVWIPHIFLIIFDIYNGNEILLIISAYIFYGLAYLPFLYIFARSFKSISSLTSFIFFIFIISTITPMILSQSEETMKQYHIIISIMSLIPDFLLKNQLKIINENYFITRRYELSKYKPSPANLTGKQNGELNILSFYFYSIALFLIGELILILFLDNIKYRSLFSKCWNKMQCCRQKLKTNDKTSIAPSENDYEETDVLDEKNKVQTIRKENNDCDYPLVVSDLHKYYNDELHAVKGVNFAVDTGECFGLLGLNGAGKTTLFKMLTANETISTGSIFLKGIQQSTNLNDYKRLYGYCPQNHALNDYMTGYQILKYMALLRGMEGNKINLHIDYLLRELKLLSYKDIQIKKYSGGTKRKLSTALALIGDPPLILLDEPTTGVDPISRRCMWRIIQDLQSNNKTIILTSHSMDECEYLCNRLAIMAEGQFQCFGYIQALKSKYGDGPTFSLKLKNKNDDTKIKNAINQYIKCKLREQHAEILTYNIKKTEYRWCKIFEHLEAFYNDYDNILDDYSVNETSLEDIFLKFDNSYNPDTMPVTEV